jgi:hypothetical protein
MNVNEWRCEDMSDTTSGGIGFSGMLTVLFIGLKLTDNINWSWWWVLSPTLIPLGIILFIALVVVIWGAIDYYY